MKNPTILVADGDSKNIQILRENLEVSGFDVIAASDGMQAWQKISSDAPDLILSEVDLPKFDGFQLLEKLQADPTTSSIPLMFLTNRRDQQDRVRGLRGGVQDYMIKPLHVKEVVARIRMILRRRQRIKGDAAEDTQKLVGRLEKFNPIDLIESFGVERKTGILTLNNENNRRGEIYFRDGAVINSSLGNLKAEKAVYQMLPWKQGHFTMLFKDIDVPDEISVSNLGLLLQGFRRIEERERLFKLLPSPETTFETTETFQKLIQKKNLTSDAAKFVNMLNGKRDILQIIDESSYDDIKTLQRLVKLYEQGFIKSPGVVVSEKNKTDVTKGAAESDIDEDLVSSSQLSETVESTTVVINGTDLETDEDETKDIQDELSEQEYPIDETVRVKQTEASDRKELERPWAEQVRSSDANSDNEKIDTVEIGDLYGGHDNDTKPIIQEDWNGLSLESEMPPFDFASDQETVIIDSNAPRNDFSKPEEKFENDENIVALDIEEPAFVEKPELLNDNTVTDIGSDSVDAVTTEESDVRSYLLKLISSNNDTSRPKMIVIGQNGNKISLFLKNLIGDHGACEKITSKAFQYLERGELQLNSEKNIGVIGLSMEPQSTKLIQTIAQDLVGFVILVEPDNQEDLSYQGYLLSTLKTNYKVPYGIAVTTSDTGSDLSLDSIQASLTVKKDDYIKHCNTSNYISIIDFFEGLTSDENIAHCLPDEGTE